MKRNQLIGSFDQEKSIAQKQRVAFHEAGHAAGIYLINKARKLPPLFLKFVFKEMRDITATDVKYHQTAHGDCIARVEGGRLIELLPASVDSLLHDLTQHNEAIALLAKDYRRAFEANIINLLIGPLAEAKHVADTDGELFNQKLVNLLALKNYGGRSDLALVNEYLQSYSADKQQQNEKLAELFTLAFDFINNTKNWAAISKLADYILAGNTNTIHCEEIVSTLDPSVAHFQLS